MLMMALAVFALLAHGESFRMEPGLGGGLTDSSGALRGDTLPRPDVAYAWHARRRRMNWVQVLKAKRHSEPATRTASTNFTFTGGNFWNSDKKWIHFVASDEADRVYEESPTTLDASWKWNNYRLGDGFRGYNGADNVHDVCKAYPGSILCEYLQKRTKKEKDMPTLLKIIDRRIQIGVNRSDSLGGPIPAENFAVVHLRLGDGLCAPDDSMEGCARPEGVTDCWKDDLACFRRPWGQYAFSEKHYADVPPVLERNQTVAIVSEVRHWTRSPDPRKGNFSNDFAYRLSAATFFRKHGFAPLVRKSGTPDEDFLYMAATKTLVLSGSGFSRLAGSVVKKRGGKVIKPLGCCQTR